MIRCVARFYMYQQFTQGKIVCGCSQIRLAAVAAETDEVYAQLKDNPTVAEIVAQKSQYVDPQSQVHNASCTDGDNALTAQTVDVVEANCDTFHSSSEPVPVVLQCDALQVLNIASIEQCQNISRIANVDKTQSLQQMLCSSSDVAPIISSCVATNVEFQTPQKRTEGKNRRSKKQHPPATRKYNSSACNKLTSSEKLKYDLPEGVMELVPKQAPRQTRHKSARTMHPQAALKMMSLEEALKLAHQQPSCPQWKH
ncbi:hypothetical protein EMCRGX_G028945 [Ephydatia muelleri]